MVNPEWMLPANLVAVSALGAAIEHGCVVFVLSSAIGKGNALPFYHQFAALMIARSVLACKSLTRCFATETYRLDCHHFGS